MLGYWIRCFFYYQMFSIRKSKTLFCWNNITSFIDKNV